MSRLSRAKMQRLAYVIVEALKRSPHIRLHQDEQQLRWEIYTWIDQLMEAERQVEARVRQKMVRMYRNVPEGSSEWQLLFRRLYDEELQAMGKYRR